MVDLDDTLFPQSAYLEGAVAAVAGAAAARGLDGAAVRAALATEIAAGSDRGGTIDRALLAVGVPAAAVRDHVPALVAAFAGHRPAALPLYPGTAEALDALAAVLPLACLTDGEPGIQAAKLAATGLDRRLPVVVVTDALGGRQLRKPHPAGLVEAARQLGVPASTLLVIGDRPAKDVAVAAAVGARAVRVRQGEHARVPDEPAAWAVTGSFPEAAALVLSVLAGAHPSVPAGGELAGRAAAP